MKRKLENPFEAPGKWYKANLHTHTTTSDGRISVAGRVAQYRKAGYDVLAITDHHATNDVSGLSDKKMIVISGTEYHPNCPEGPMMYHFVGLNIPHGFEFVDQDDSARCIAQVKKVGGETILAHPYWSGHQYESIKGLLDKFVAIEVYNSTCDRHGMPCSENEWAEYINTGHVMPCVGSDDAHREEEDVFEAWTWLKMPSLSVANVLDALRKGRCYASCGPKIHDFRVKDGKALLRCSPVEKIHFVSVPGRGVRRRATEGKSVKNFDFEVPASWSYVRAVVTDHTGRRAWANPIMMKAGRK